MASSPSFAESTTVVAAPAPTPLAETRGYAGPNRILIGSGFMTFGLAYIPSVIVAGTSGLAADHHLFVPVVGPWLDLGERPGCAAGSTNCDGETTNKVLLAADGVFQGLGVLTVIAGFLNPERDRVLVTTSKGPEAPSFHLAPARLGSDAYGLQAYGKF
jgi:hypothetical protein